MKEEKNGARAYRTSVVGDSMNLTINLKWLIQLFVLCAMIVYGWYQLETRIQALERNMVLALEEIELHDQERRLAEEQHIQDMESLLKTELNINPLSWQWGKKK